MSLIVNVVIPLFFSFIVICISGVINRWLGSRLSALALTLASVMAIPFVFAAMFQISLTAVGHVFVIAPLVVFAIHFYKKGKALDLLSMFDKCDLLNLGIIAILVFGPLLPGLWGGGYFITNPNFDFIYQSVDARYMATHDPTVFDPPLNGSLDLPLDWSANQQGRYLSSVLQAAMAKYFFHGKILEGSVSAFVYFYIVFAVSVYVFLGSFLASKKNVLLATILTMTSAYAWVPIRYMLIGQLSSISIFLLLIGGFARLLAKKELPLFKEVLPLAVTLGFLGIIYFALGFFAVCIIGLIYLLSGIEVSFKRKIIFLFVPVGICSIVYFLPYITKPQVMVEIISHWFEVIFSKMYSQVNIDQICVEYLGELISLRMLGFDPLHLSMINDSLVDPLSGMYVITCILAWLGYGYMTFLVWRRGSETGALVKATWLTMSGFVCLFFATQGGYLVFKSLSYLFFAPALTYFALLESKNLGAIHKRIVGTIALTLGCISLSGIFVENEELLSDRIGSRFGIGIGMNRDYVQLINYLRTKTPNQKITLALPTPNQQGYVLLGAGNYQNAGIGQNSQVLENARWSSGACDLPNLSNTDLIVVPSRFSSTADAASNPTYTNPVFENSQYAVVEFKNIHKLIVFSRGFYSPEPVQMAWNSTYEIARWSTGRSAILVYSDEASLGVSGRILTYGDLILKSSAIKDGGIMLAGMPKFQNLTFTKIDKGWQCIEISGETEFKKSPLNRWIFTFRDRDPRPIKYLLGGVDVW